MIVTNIFTEKRNPDETKHSEVQGHRSRYGSVRPQITRSFTTCMATVAIMVLSGHTLHTDSLQFMIRIRSYRAL
jgi:hypothetical protein